MLSLLVAGGVAVRLSGISQLVGGWVCYTDGNNFNELWIWYMEHVPLQLDTITML